MTISATYLGIELRRQARNFFTLAFVLAMPVVMYLLFGASADYASVTAMHGNVAYTVMTSMAAYGTATAMTSLTSLAASEFSRGWGRQIALTPMTTFSYAATKVLVAVAYSALSVAAVFLVGALTGASVDAGWRWWATAGIILGVGLMFGLFGLGVGMIFNSDSAAGIAPILLTFFAFFGNVFMPLSGGMLDAAHFTPLYGFVALARWPQLEGHLSSGGSDPLWMLVLSVVVWSLIFALLVRLGIRRTRGRQ